MAFTDLPDDTPDRPLTDPTFVADVLDLVVPESDRRRGALAILLCDDEARLLAPVVVGELGDGIPAEEREQALGTIVSALDRRGCVLVAVARRHGLSIRDDDHVWADAARRACRGGTRLLGVHVITLDGSREVAARAA